jgi:BlaI family transcriptional regulator, penicillinase repressor
MARPITGELTDRELEVMHLYWQSSELTAQEARDHLATSGRELTYPTVANLVRTLEEKGFLKAVNDARPFRYAACRTHEDVSKNLLADLIGRVFGGSREALFVRLFDSGKLSKQEREMLQKLLKEGQS